MELNWPIGGKQPITQKFGENPGDYTRFGLKGHNGVDIAVPEGTPVMAAADGMVEKIGFDPGGYGTYVKILHDGGVETLYAHLTKQLVTQGDNVACGQAIGKSGNTGNSTGPHLHFEVRLPGQAGNGYNGAVDPLPLLNEELPVPIPEQPQPELVGTALAQDGLNVRSGPAVAYRKVGFLQPGDQVGIEQVWARTTDGRWVAVFYDGQKLLELK
jgi:hypothetical protein